ncbi:hypothetical protein LWC35_33885 [Pseudonocardia kujensis]|uniref:hypothetical protein n=1 Tax=Pseudonocardia kujensis TaxID=1128675 RepID=UPI001E3A37C4|nr:hypothetical protein [Pseudonocardia kujensis]MCE0767854.1 hypothetical protein [Pseudonocardia kujensis]
MRELTAEPVTGPVAHHGEGPVRHPSYAGVRWGDMLAGDILELAGGEVRRTHVAAVAAAFRPRRGGGTVLAGERSLLLLDDDLRCERDLGPVASRPTAGSTPASGCPSPGSPRAPSAARTSPRCT